ncbi:hypothetical protein [Enterococcus faecium]|uniref:hypothetical protein n=1 Tax=Enterococcus faecium TaxID=1352 RepID=UPI000BEF4004|nr:hypothetical protein [Enterococcus faecium]PEH49305.1 hypothetical protein CRM75_16130 [Enterococcus faecium]
MTHAPNTKFLKGISDGLATTGNPIYFKLPNANVKEPFYVIGNHLDDDSKSAKFGPAINDTDLQLDLFYPINSRTMLEDAVHQTKAVLGNRNSMTSDIRIDNSIGREVYHVVFKISDYII